MPQIADRLVGRAAELEVLDQTLAELERRRSRALELVGEPGIGKTRMLAELAERADGRGQLVLSGGASELERELPFSIFVDALDDYLYALEPRRLGQLVDDARDELGQVFPSLADRAGAAPPEADRYRMYRAVRQLLEALADAKPLVLLLDDLHWADAGSIELLGSLLRRPPAARVLIALAVRPRQLPERLSGALDRAARAGTLDAHRARRAERRRGGGAAGRRCRAAVRARAAATRSTCSSSRARRGVRRRARAWSWPAWRSRTRWRPR